MIRKKDAYFLYKLVILKNKVSQILPKFHFTIASSKSTNFTHREA
jgi:hypothetical protein